MRVCPEVMLAPNRSLSSFVGEMRWGHVGRLEEAAGSCGAFFFNAKGCERKQEGPQVLVLPLSPVSIFFMCLVPV